MVRIVHISDLHFGRTRAELVQPLLATIAALRPELVVMSGDLTQRATADEFRDGMAMMRRITVPVLMVPGNHDMPLYNLVARMLAPFGRWRRWVGELAPVCRGAGFLILGMNTADPFAHERGRVRPAELTRVCDALRATGRDRLRVVVMHHPLAVPPGVDKEPMRGAEGAAEALIAAGVDLVLAGHLHSWGADPFAARGSGRAALFVQAGTGLSTRLRGEPNDFNLIEAQDDRIAVTRYHVGAAGTVFEAEARAEFVRGDAGWARSDG